MVPDQNRLASMALFRDDQALSDAIGDTDMRSGTVHRVTGETDEGVRLDLDGSGQCQPAPACPFLITCCIRSAATA